MRVVDTKQNSKEWKDWRGKGLGASDAPVVMGVSPWQTAFELWLEKTGLCERPEANPFAIVAMRRGTELEPKARVLCERDTGLAFNPISGEHSEYSFIRASLDGYNDETNTILEIKCPGKEDLAKAKKGIVPDKYYPQIQQQFLVSGATTCLYYVWDGVSDSGISITVKPDADYIEKLKDSLISFWSHVNTRIPPQCTSETLRKLTERLALDTKRLSNTATALEMAATALVA